MMPNRVFRAASLERLSSPEQLDQLMVVTTTKGWLALGALALLLVTGVTWSILGAIPDRVNGQGILVKSGGVFEVVPAGAGRLTDVAVNVGDVVSEGQIVARIAQPELTERVRQARASLDNARAELARLTGASSEDARIQGTLLTQQQRGLEQSIAADEQGLRYLQDKLASQQQLVDQGLLTKQAWLATRQQLDGLQEKIRSSRANLVQLTANDARTRAQRTQQNAEAQFRVAQADRDVAQASAQLREQTEVRSPYSGRILELMAEQGSIVGHGEPIMRLDLTGRTVQDLEAVLYVSSEQGKKLRPGMTVHIAPSTVKQEEFGYMLAKVTYVSDFPATSRGMQRVLKNETLVGALSRNDAPYEIHAELVPDAETTSRYRWSSSHGPPMTIQSGTLCTADVVIEERHPIAMVLPLIRRYTGV